MRHRPDVATVGALVGDPARARMLMALMGGRALTATELALEAGIAASTASSHLAKLASASLVRVEKQGRHRYYALFEPEVAEALEALHLVARPLVSSNSCPRELRVARVCYDHLAGERGVWLFERLREREILAGDHGLTVSDDGQAFFRRFGIDIAALDRSRRMLCRPCLDWSERVHHLGGALGAAILARILQLRWAERDPAGGRAVRFSHDGDRALRRLLGARL